MKQLLEKLTTLAAYTAAVCTIVILLVTSINIIASIRVFIKRNMHHWKLHSL